MRIGRTLPPAAAPIYLRDILSGILALHHGQQELARFKAELKDYFGVQHCFLVSSGKAALTLILQALNELYPDKNRVLIPAYACYSLPSAIVRARLKIQLCDMDPETLDFDYTHLSKLLHPPNIEPNKPFLCIIPAHLFGIPFHIDRLRSLLGDSEVIIIEDAAQAMGGEWQGKKLGTFGDVAFSSLGRGKALSTVEGGIILTNRDDIGRKMSALLTRVPAYTVNELFRLIIEAISLNLFMRPTLFWLPKSLPFLKLGATTYDPDFKIRQMSPFQAGMARNWETKIREFQKIRKAHSKMWSTLINDLKTHKLSAINHPPDSDLIRFPMRVVDSSLRKAILSQSEQKGLGIMPTYPDSINGIPALRDIFSTQQFPVAKQYSQQLITLPVHPYVSKRDRTKITTTITQQTQRTQRTQQAQVTQ
jgi:dTDP-4-amino-4,6-dideoxygalactose transaminase